jgi:hypothetical protein
MQTADSASDKNSKSPAEKHGFTGFMRKYYPLIVWYILGLATPFIILILLVTLGVKPPKIKSQALIDKWHIQESNEVLLLINVPVEPNIYMAVGVERDPNTGWVKQVGISKGNNLGGSAFFTYIAKGKYGAPMCYYGFAENGLIWRDLNFDSYFDQLIDYKNKLMKINVDDRWIKGLMRDKAVITDEGLFVFDPNVGGWKHSQ